MEVGRRPRVLGDKGSLSLPVAADLLATTGSDPLTVPRNNQRRPLSTQFHIEQNRAHTCEGRCIRLSSKRAAHPLGIDPNRLLGGPDPLHPKALAFPNEHTGL